MDESKKLDEITPLLHQASISSASSKHPDYYQRVVIDGIGSELPTTNGTSIHTNGNENTSVNSIENGSGKHSSHKSSYRKRFKTKSSRKSTSFNDN